MNRTRFLLAFMLTAALALSAHAQSKEQDRLENSGRVMKEIMDIPDNIPQSVIDKADMAGEPYGFPALGDDSRRVGVFPFPSRFDECFLQRHVSLLCFVSEWSSRETQRSEPFLRSQREMIRASTELRVAQAELVEHFGKQYGFPTRTELDDVHRTLTEMRREMRRLRRTLADAQGVQSARKRKATV